MIIHKFKCTEGTRYDGYWYRNLDNSLQHRTVNVKFVFHYSYSYNNDFGNTYLISTKEQYARNNIRY